VITSPSGSPNPAWLNFVVTAKARSNIRNFLKHMQTDEAIAQGKRLIERCLKGLGMRLDDVPGEAMQAFLEECGFERVEQLLEDIGMGNRPPNLVARRLVPERIPHGDSEETREMKSQAPLAIHGTEGMVVSYAKCCHPIPGDQIIGMMSKGRGIVVHRDACNNLGADRAQHELSDKYIDVKWSEDAIGEFATVVKMDVANEPGVLARTATVLSDEGTNISNVDLEDNKDGFTTTITYQLDVHDRQHLARALRRLRRIPNVMRLWRL
jgi:(p)ppGpp synthase/HD superfamily hydrolase